MESKVNLSWENNFLDLLETDKNVQYIREIC